MFFGFPSSIFLGPLSYTGLCVLPLLERLNKDFKALKAVIYLVLYLIIELNNLMPIKVI